MDKKATINNNLFIKHLFSRCKSKEWTRVPKGWPAGGNRIFGNKSQPNG
jgi:hypothetical protein